MSNSNNYIGNVAVLSGSIQGKVYSNGVLGGVQVGGINTTIYPEIPPATQDRLGGVMVGEHLSITEEGLLSVIVAATASVRYTSCRLPRRLWQQPTLFPTSRPTAKSTSPLAVWRRIPARQTIRAVKLIHILRSEAIP